MKATNSTKTFTIVLPIQFYQGLERAALDQDRSKNYLVKKAVENYLEDLYFSKKAEAVLAKNEPTYTLEEIAEKYGLSDHLQKVGKKRPTKTRKITTKKNLRVSK
jgi:predicted DNA-binding protein